MNEVNDESTSLEKVESSNGWLIFIIFFCIGCALSYGAPKIYTKYLDYKEAKNPPGGQMHICRFQLEGEAGYYERQCRVVGTYAYINDGVQKDEK